MHTIPRLTWERQDTAVRIGIVAMMAAVVAPSAAASWSAVEWRFGTLVHQNRVPGPTSAASGSLMAPMLVVGILLICLVWAGLRLRTRRDRLEKRLSSLRAPTDADPDPSPVPAYWGPENDPHSPDRLELIRELRRGIEHGELVLHYQPKAELKTGCAEHFEALVRWQHPRRGLMAPHEFLALAEHAGLIMPLSLWVLDAALRQLRAWRQADLDISVAVNISARTLHDPELITNIRRQLQRWQVEARCLEIEITEGALMEDPAGAMRTLTELSEMGICISIDDFGTGYSSLSYLTRVPANQIKIDKSFVIDMARNRDSAHIVRSVIDLGHNLSLQVVAEGVEDQATWDMLADMGCDAVQGFHLSRPLAASEVGPWLRSPQSRLSYAS